MKDRIRQLMLSKQMTQQEFANFIKISPASLSSVFNGRTRPTLNIIEAIKSKMPDVDINWLLFGEGDMLANDKQTAGDTPRQDSRDGGGKPHANDGDTPARRPGADVTASAHGDDSARGEPVRAEVTRVETPQRKITEIKVYFDDRTYETFVPKADEAQTKKENKNTSRVR